MATIKTAISVDSSLMKEVDTWAQALKISRSRLFAMGVEKLIQQYKSKRMVEAINSVYAEPSANETAHLDAMYATFGELMVGEEW